MKKVSLFLMSLALCLTFGLSAQTTNLAYFPFTDNVAAPNTPTSYLAASGTQSGVAGLYLDGTNGSSAWVAASELTANNGSAINALNGAAAGKDLAMINSAANGKSIVFKLSTAGYQNLVLTMAARYTQSGFHTTTWAYSTDGTNFTTMTGVSSMPTAVSTYELVTLDFSSYTALNDQANVYLKCTLDGATSENGSYRMDNVQLNAVPSGPDVYAPVVSTVDVDNSTTLIVTFNELLNATSAQNTANYLLDGAAATQATLASSVVTVTVPAMTEGTTHTLIVQNVTDTAGNMMAPDTTSFTYGIDAQYHVQTIAELRAKWTDALDANGSHFGDQVYKMAGNVIVTAINASYRNQIFIQDSTAAIVIDDANGNITRALEIGDEITDIYGTLTDYFGQLQFVVTQNCSEALSIFNEVTPLTITLDQLQDIAYMNEHQSELIRIDNVTFSETGTFANNTKYNITQSGTTAEAVWVHIWNIASLTGADIPSTATNLTGVNKINYSKYYLIPRSGTDLGTGMCHYLSAKDVLIYPNPAVNMLRVNVTNSQYQVSTLQIFDFNGRLIRTENVQNQVMNVPVNDLIAGTYFIRLSDGNASYTAKFIKR